MTKSLPRGWQCVRLGDVLEQLSRFEPVEPDHEYRLLGVKWYAEGVFEREHKLGKAISAKQLNRVEEGDFIYNRLFAWKGSFAVVGNGHAGGHVSGEFPVFRAKPGLILAEFLYRYFSRPRVWKQIEHQSTGTTSVSRNRWKEEQFCAWHISLPPLKEQERIVSILRGVGEAIRANEDVLARSRGLKQALARRLVTCGIAHTEFKDTESGRIPKAWDVVSLDAIAQVDRGKFAHRPRNDPRFYGGSIPFVQTGDVAACNGGYLRSFMQTLNDDGLKISRVFPRGTLVVTIAANICDTAIATFDVAFPDSLVGIIPGPLVRAEYLQLALQKVKARLEHAAPETAQKNINLDILRPLRIPLPPISEQDQMCVAITAIETRIEQEILKLKNLERFKRELMQVLLIGHHGC